MKERQIIYSGKMRKSKTVYLNCPDELTSNPCSRPTFIMSLHLFGTMHMTSTAFCYI